MTFSKILGAATIATLLTFAANDDVFGQNNKKAKAPAKAKSTQVAESDNSIYGVVSMNFDKGAFEPRSKTPAKTKAKTSTSSKKPKCDGAYQGEPEQFVLDSTAKPVIYYDEQSELFGEIRQGSTWGKAGLSYGIQEDGGDTLKVVNVTLKGCRNNANGGVDSTEYTTQYTIGNNRSWMNNKPEDDAPFGIVKRYSDESTRHFDATGQSEGDSHFIVGVPMPLEAGNKEYELAIDLNNAIIIQSNEMTEQGQKIPVRTARKAPQYKK